MRWVKHVEPKANGMKLGICQPEESIYEIQWTQAWLRQTGDEALAQEGQHVCEQFELRG